MTVILPRFLAVAAAARWYGRLPRSSTFVGEANAEARLQASIEMCNHMCGILHVAMNLAIDPDILDRFAALPLLVPDQRDHVEAAELRTSAAAAAFKLRTSAAAAAFKSARSMRCWRSFVSATTSRC